MNTAEHMRKIQLMAQDIPRTSTTVSHTIRTRDGGTKELKYGRAKAIKLFCTECLGWGDHPKDCTSPLCPLFPFRGLTLLSQHSTADENDTDEQETEE